MPTKKTKIYGTEIYGEKLRSLDPIGYFGLPLTLGAVLFITLYWDTTLQHTLGGWVWIILLNCIMIFAVILFWYPKLVISVTSESITVKHGILKRVILLEDIIDYCTKDFSLGKGPFTTSISMSNGKWRLMYYVHDGPGSQRRVVLKLKRGMTKEFAFFSRDPDAVIELIKQHIGKQEKQETIA